MKLLPLLRRAARGQIVLLAFVFMSVILTLSAVLASYIGLYVKAERESVASAEALAIAEGGIDAAVSALNQNGSYSGQSNVPLGYGAFTTTVTTESSGVRHIVSTGSVPATDPLATRAVAATISINSSVVSFRYGVQIGDGGVTMANGSKIEGNIYSDGTVSGSGTITGDATVAGGTEAGANQIWDVANSAVTLGDVATHADIAQPFVPSASGPLNKVSLYLKKIGSPGDIAIKVVTDNSGQPSTSVLASGAIPASATVAVYGFTDVTLNTSPSLTAGNKYWIIAIAPVDADNYYVWGADSSAGYPGGAGDNSADWSAHNAVWAPLGQSLDFKIWMGGVVTSLSGVTVNGNAWAESLSNCTVGGDARYESMTSCTVGGTSYPNTAPPSPQSFSIPDAEIYTWENAASSGGAIAGNYTIANNTTRTLGPVEIDGNLTVNGTLSLSGPIWVNGSVTFGVGSALTVDSSTGSSGAILIADNKSDPAGSGTVYLANNVSVSGNGNAGSNPMVVSMNTGANAVSLNNNAQSIILYASHGTVNVANNASASEITAYAMNMQNNSTVYYTSGLQSQSFSNGPGGSWAVVPGTYAITQ